MKKKILIAVSVFAIILLGVFILRQRETKTLKVDDYTETNMIDSSIREVCVVINPPSKLSDFKLLVKKYLASHKRNTGFREHTVIFIREHSNSFLTSFFEERVSYVQEYPSEIQEIDLLGEIFWFRSKSSGKEELIITYYNAPGRQYQ